MADKFKRYGVPVRLENTPIFKRILQKITSVFGSGTGKKSVTVNAIDGEYVNVASGDYSVATGRNTKAYGAASMTVGVDTQTGRSDRADKGIGSFAMGAGCKADGNRSFAGGVSSTANGTASFAFGAALDDGTNTLAGGENSTAIGRGTQAFGQYANAYGYGLKLQTSDIQGQMALGKFNEMPEAGVVFLVGCGASNSSRRTAFQISANGTATYNYNIRCRKEPTNNQDLTTKKYVDDAIAALKAELTQ